MRTGKLILLLLSLYFSNTINGQAPTSLQYPTPNVFNVNQDNVLLSPTVAGNVVSYAINPSLPAGLSFNTSTGVISGLPTAASVATNYTITATNGSGSANTTISIQTNNYTFNNAGAQISFLAANAVPKVYTTVPTAGRNANDIVLYTNVVTVSGQTIDCIVKTVTVNNVSSWDAYDQSAAMGSNFNSNSDNYFSPQVTFGASPGGSLTFDFQFILGGTYNNGTNTGTNVTLQNVYLNTYDIDGNGTAIQNNEFGGFASSELGTTTNEVVTYNATTGLTRFTSNTSANTTTVTDPINRIRVNYNNVSDFRITVAANNSGLAFYFLDFSFGSAFTTTTTTVPSIDLNTTTTGSNNLNAGCGSLLSFSGGTGQTNTSSGANLTEFTLQFPTASILNGANERINISGATSGGTIALNFANAAAIPNVVFGTTITYAVAATVSGGISRLSFTRTAGTSQFTPARAEELVDGLQYQNIAASPTNGDRAITVNMRNTQYKSPDAIFTARLNCVSISGNIYHDANALTDNTVNANSTTGQFANSSMYAILVDPVTDLVLASQAITGSAYNFGTATAGKYNILFSNNTPPGNGTSFTNSTFPAGSYIATGENLGAGAGNDLGVDGKMIITVGSIAVTNANFGLQVPPTATGINESSSLNPGGFNAKTLTGTNFGTGDADGTVSSVTITSFPTNTNYLRVGTTVYTNGGTCPPQSTCTAWPGTVVVPYSSGSPGSAIAIDPVNGAATAIVNYVSTDNGGASSSASSIQVPFTVLSTPLTITGNVWNDANGNAALNGSESLTDAANAGQTLYAVLVQTTNTYSGAATVYASAAINASTGYTFADVPSGNNYQVRIVSLSSAPTDGSAFSLLSPALATGYTAVSTNNSGSTTTGLNTNNPVNTINSFTASVVNVNFGIDRLPTAANAAHVIAQPAPAGTLSLTSGNGMSALAGADPEDGTIGSGSSFRITSLTGMNGNELRYNGALLSAGSTIPNYNPGLLTIRFSGVGSTSASFNFVTIDAAGVPAATPASYAISWTYVLPVTLVSFEAKLVNHKVQLVWITENEIDIREYRIQRSVDGINWQYISTQQAIANSKYVAEDLSPASGNNYYRLEIISLNGEKEYSAIRRAIVTNQLGKIIISPNPAGNHVTIRPANAELNKIEFINTAGQVILVTWIVGITDINIHHLASGLYMVRCLTRNNDLTVLKLIKN